MTEKTPEISTIKAALLTIGVALLAIASIIVIVLGSEQ